MCKMHIHFFITQRESKVTFIKKVNFTQYLKRKLGFPDIIRKLERFSNLKLISIWT